MNGLRGKTAIVTGGSSGIGQAIAVRLAHEGVNVAIDYVGPPEGALATRDAIESGLGACLGAMRDDGPEALLVEADVSDDDEVSGMFRQVVGHFGRVDLLVNNAGIQLSSPSHELSPAAFDRVLAANLRGSFLCAQHPVRHLVAQDRPGAIVNISSVHQEIPKPGFLGYSVSKGGMQNLTRTLALEYAGRGIGVGRAPPRRWPPSPRSSSATRPPTSPARPSSSTAG